MRMHKRDCVKTKHLPWQHVSRCQLPADLDRDCQTRQGRRRLQILGPNSPVGV